MTAHLSLGDFSRLYDGYPGPPEGSDIVKCLASRLGWLEVKACNLMDEIETLRKGLGEGRST